MGACVFQGQLMHQRLQPFVHQFSYPIQYIHTPLDLIGNLPLSNKRFGLLSLRPQDHGDRMSQNLEPWARALLQRYCFRPKIATINLLAIPRSLGMHFNPVSFWFCLDAQHNLRAIICQVNNTFGESHSYLCYRPDQGAITSDDRLSLSKKFHVSPFFPRVGCYIFYFDYQPVSAISIIIHYRNNNDCQLRTSLIGKLVPLTRASVWRILRSQPFIGIGAYARIHRQAWRLWRCGAQYHRKPRQLSSHASND